MSNKGEATPPVGAEDPVPFRVEQALAAYDRGYVLTPLNGKRPYLKGWQHRPAPSRDEVERWAREGNVGARTGAASGVVVIDDDNLDGAGAVALNLPTTVTAVSGRGGRHYYYRCPEDGLGCSNAGLPLKVDVRGDRGAIALPGSVHHDTGAVYTWLPGHSPDEMDPAPFPERVLKLLRHPQAKKAPKQPREISGLTTTASSADPMGIAPQGSGEARADAQDEGADDGHHDGEGSRPDPGAVQPRAKGPGFDQLAPAELKRLKAYADKVMERTLEDLRTAGEGTRNDTLNRSAFKLGQYIGGGLIDEHDALNELHSAGASVGLDDAEVRATARSGMESGECDPIVPAALLAQLEARAKMPKYTDSRNAELFVELSQGDLRYCKPQKQWFSWREKVWEPDLTNAPLRHCKRVIKRLEKDVAKLRTEEEQEIALKWARSSASTNRRKGMLDLAAAEFACAIRPDAFDADSWLFNCANGTLDLRTGTLRPHRREDFITKIAPTKFVPGATSPLWENFLLAVVPDAEHRAFLQRWAGLSLTGDQGDQKFLILHGDGANGKSTVLRVQQGVMGTGYAINASSELLTQKRERGHPTEYADLAGARLVICAEMNQGDELDESSVKRLTGGERVRARRMREDFWEFDPSHHFVIATNHLPHVRGRDHAIWRRMLVLKFIVKIEAKDQDPQLVERLLAEREGILQWMLEGLADWRARGNRLDPPASMLAQTTRHRAETDLVRRFIEACCEPVPNARTRAADLYSAFQTWCESIGICPSPQRTFGEDLRGVGLESVKSGGLIVYLNIRPNPVGGPEKQGQGGSGTTCRLSLHSEDPSIGEHPAGGPQSSPDGPPAGDQVGLDAPYEREL